jgi:hypothetical protein
MTSLFTSSKSLHVDSEYCRKGGWKIFPDMQSYDVDGVLTFFGWGLLLCLFLSRFKYEQSLTLSSSDWVIGYQSTAVALLFYLLCHANFKFFYIEKCMPFLKGTKRCPLKGTKRCPLSAWKYIKKLINILL